MDDAPNIVLGIIKVSRIRMSMAALDVWLGNTGSKLNLALFSAIAVAPLLVQLVRHPIAVRMRAGLLELL